MNLRVYDVTGIIFDGTNAHSYFDHRVERSDRQWFFAINDPGSTAVVELGMKSNEGYFVKIARSGRVEFPRHESEGSSEPEWLTVFADSMHRAGAGSPRPRDGGPRTEGVGGPSTPFAPIPLWHVLHPSPGIQEIFFQWPEGRDLIEWRQLSGDGWFQIGGRTEWVGPLTMTSWEAGPFANPVEIQPPVQLSWQGSSFAYQNEGVTHVVYGPWEVVVRNLNAHASGRVLGRWAVYRSWVSQTGRELRGEMSTRGKTLRLGASESAALGASERVWLGASELRLGGASEVWRLGASEVRFSGASETLFAGASQWMLRGASERLFLGASQWMLRGASERLFVGASEKRMLGASERMLGGASERARGGASEGYVGGSEQLVRVDSGASSNASDPVGYPKLGD